MNKSIIPALREVDCSLVLVLFYNFNRDWGVCVHFVSLRRGYFNRTVGSKQMNIKPERVRRLGWLPGRPLKP